MNNQNDNGLEITLLMHRQDDPNKCTASRLLKFKIAKEVRKVPPNFITLNPFSTTILTNEDRRKYRGVCAIDCSWKLADNVIKISKKFSNTRKLPTLLAGNPTNYSKLGILSTVEAVAAALYIMNYKSLSRNILCKFRWGHTFLDLNINLLEEYSYAKDQQEVEKIEKEYFPNLHSY